MGLAYLEQDDRNDNRFENACPTGIRWRIRSRSDLDMEVVQPRGRLRLDKQG